MTIHWKALGKHFQTVPFVVRFIQFLGNKCIFCIFLKKPRSLKSLSFQRPFNNLLPESFISLSHEEYLVSEDVGVIDFAVMRMGSDLSHESTVWCSTREFDPLSATPGQDFIPTSHQITFAPGQTEAVSIPSEGNAQQIFH
jgi:hypothetical protein